MLDRLQFLHDHDPKIADCLLHCNRTFFGTCNKISSQLWNTSEHHLQSIVASKVDKFSAIRTNAWFLLMANKNFALSEAAFVIGTGPTCCGSHGVCLLFLTKNKCCSWPGGGKNTEKGCSI
jgi:hypothetical protein